MVGALADGVSSFAEIGANLVKGLWSGIQSLAGWLWDKVSGWISSIWDGICDFFGIASPSKLFKNGLGRNLMLGLAEGIAAEGQTAIDATMDVAEDVAAVDFTTKPPDVPGPGSVDYAAIAANARSTAQTAITETGTAVSAGSASENYRGGSDAPTDTGNEGAGGNPQYIQNDIHLDGKRVARVLTPYVAEELEWEGK